MKIVIIENSDPDVAMKVAAKVKEQMGGSVIEVTDNSSEIPPAQPVTTEEPPVRRGWLSNLNPLRQ